MLNLEKILYRIILGYYYIDIHNETYKVLSPSIEIKYLSEILYDKTIEENKYDKRWLTDDEIEYYLLINNLWNKNEETTLKAVEKSIEDTKIDIFQNFINFKIKDKFKRQLKSLENQYIKLLNKKRSLDSLGIKEYASSIKNEFIIQNCIYDKNNNLLFNQKEDNCNHNKLHNIFIREIIDQTIQVSDMKALARSDLWRSYILSCKLEKDLINITDDYKYLINLHKMYDNARQHPEAPSEDIINDDDALDGWFLFHNRKAAQEKKKNLMQNKVGNKNNQHNFIFASSPEEAQAIMDSNNPREKLFAEQLIETAKAKPEEKWENIPIVKQELLNRLSEQNLGIK